MHLEIDLPEIERVLRVTPHIASTWASTFRIDAQLRDESEESYFLKVSGNCEPAAVENKSSAVE